MPDNPLLLPALRADVPIGFMATLGLWRILQKDEQFGEVRLSWYEAGGSFRPQLHSAQECTEADVIRACLDHLQRWPERDVFIARDAVKKTTSTEWLALIEQNQAHLEFLGGLAAANRDREGAVAPSPLDMSFASQKFLADVVKLHAEILKGGGKKGPTTAAMFREAIFETWRYRDDVHSRGWDAATIKEAAFTHQEPSPMPNAGVRAAVWLAIHSLPCFPCFGPAEARGFRRSKDGRLLFTWPIWNRPATFETAIALLGQELVAGRGVVAVYESERKKLNQYMVSLLPPVRVV